MNFDPDLMRGIGDLLRELRIEAGMTQYDAAREVGTAQNVVSDIENGKRDSFIGTIQKFARAYGYETEVAFVKLPEENPS
jgi:transcriptional regulator with XRE-family HTH domain